MIIVIKNTIWSAFKKCQFSKQKGYHNLLVIWEIKTTIDKSTFDYQLWSLELNV